MKHQELYRKYKTNYSPAMNPWGVLIVTLIAILVEPLMASTKYKLAPFSFGSYLHQIKYFSFVGVPFGLFLFWTNWRESVKRNRGFCLVGKFEVIGKRSSFMFNHLVLSPGDKNELKVDKKLFNKIHVGDFVIIRRDALGDVNEVRSVSNFLSRMSRSRVQANSKTLKNA